MTRALPSIHPSFLMIHCMFFAFSLHLYIPPHIISCPSTPLFHSYLIKLLLIFSFLFKTIGRKMKKETIVTFFLPDSISFIWGDLSGELLICLIDDGMELYIVRVILIVVARQCFFQPFHCLNYFQSKTPASSLIQKDTTLSFNYENADKFQE